MVRYENLDGLKHVALKQLEILIKDAQTLREDEEIATALQEL